MFSLDLGEVVFGQVVEVVVGHGLLAVDALGWVVDEQAAEQVVAVVVQAWHNLGQRVCVEHDPGVGLVVGQLHNRGPVFLRKSQSRLNHTYLCGRAEDLVDLLQLVGGALTGEQRTASHHLGKDAASGPEIDWGRVLAGAHQNVGGTVPQSHYLMRVRANRDAKRSRQAEVCQLQLTFLPRVREQGRAWLKRKKLTLLMRRFWGFKSRCRTRRS